jgi:hypothetical protein
MEVVAAAPTGAIEMSVIAVTTENTIDPEVVEIRRFIQCRDTLPITGLCHEGSTSYMAGHN